MPNRPSEDGVVRQLDGAFDPGRLPTPAGAEFLAEVHARAVSAWVLRVGLVAAVVLAVIVGMLVYRIVTAPPARGSDPALEDPGSGRSAEAPLGRDEAVLSILSGR